MFKEFVSGMEVLLSLEEFNYFVKRILVCLIHVWNHIYIIHWSVLLSRLSYWNHANFYYYLKKALTFSVYSLYYIMILII